MGASRQNLTEREEEEGEAKSDTEMKCKRSGRRQKHDFEKTVHFSLCCF